MPETQAQKLCSLYVRALPVPKNGAFVSWSALIPICNTYFLKIAPKHQLKRENFNQTAFSSQKKNVIRMSMSLQVGFDPLDF